MATWVLTGSPENYEATAALGHTLIGMKERRRAMAELEWIRKWPPEHWKLASQGQLRMVSDDDARLLLEAMRR